MRDKIYFTCFLKHKIYTKSRFIEESKFQNVKGNTKVYTLNVKYDIKSPIDCNNLPRC